MAMHPKRKQRLYIVLSIVIGASVAAGLLFYAMRDNLNLFYSPSQIAAGEAPLNKRLRAGGMVLVGSVERQPDGLTTQFTVTDYDAKVRVSYKGILPDLFAEDDGVVVAGILQPDGMIIADEVLAKHDENYMPPEVADALKDKTPHGMKTGDAKPSGNAPEATNTKVY
ncbi:Cytochrome c-type biogenesis protein CcmE [BD1-7 clade bacterium]|uniref:Cytochrome c-type biogenesis protein CcmE n=1 Tax=BD1-7 clade bacterium TaxID=2029982 RepID=A0A5S9QU44_9GAMM|nr:Cytochrome c-type biogenesis protein CcmE [BD1-7 clade bacterium]